ncbi:MAG: MurR/RpiR family transcriptional regulator, partial [Erysipelotrichaceae bacterium]|nr:MurR/RpiR family transcriptional regulator [Erysipelotrichaceae bacterium]
NDELDTDFVIAKYFLNNLSRLKETSIYKVADDCFVSRSSVQRFIKNIGYDSYTQLKNGIDVVISHENGFIDYTDHSSYKEYLTGCIDEMNKDIAQTASSSAFSRFVDLFMNARNVVLVTAEDSSFPCKIFQQQLISIGKLIRITTNASTNIDLLESLEENDLLLVSSISGNFALAINDEIRDLKARKVLVTLNRSCVFENTYQFIYYLGNKTQLNSHDLMTVRNVYNNYGLSVFLDFVYHECFMRYNNKSNK